MSAVIEAPPVTADGAIAPVRTLADLRERNAWLAWRFVPPKTPIGKPTPKPRKVPVYVRGSAIGRNRAGRQGTDEDRAGLGTFAEAQAFAQRAQCAGVGLALHAGLGVVALDFDGFVQDGKVDPEIETLVRHTYAEVSPSGRGLRALVLGKLPPGWRDRKAKHDERGFETFVTKGFVTITGQVLDHVGLLHDADHLGDVTPAILDTCESCFGPAEQSGEQREAADSAPRAPIADVELPGLRDALLHVAAHDPHAREYLPWLSMLSAIHESVPDDEAARALAHEFSAALPNYDAAEVDAKLASFTRGKPGNAGAGSIYKAARAVGWEEPEAMRHQRIAAMFEDLGDAANDASEPQRRTAFTFYTAHEFALLPPPTWRVHELLPDEGVGFIYGASGSGKSFLALDLAAAVTKGAPWRGRAAIQGRVVYVAAEGGQGMTKRLRGYERRHERLPDALVLTIDAPDLRRRETCAAFAAAVKAAGGAALVIVDTLARTIPGASENDAADMGCVIDNAIGIGRELHALVLLVHHTGKDESREERGWSGLRAAVDVSLKVQRSVGQAGGARVAIVAKSKDGEDGAEFPFRLGTVNLGDTTTCVVDHLADPDPRAARADPAAKLTGHPRRAFEAVTRLTANGAAAPVDLVIDDIASKEAFDAGATDARGKPKKDRRRERTKRALDSLRDRGLIRYDATGERVLSFAFANLDHPGGED